MNRGTEIKNTEFATKRLTHWKPYLLLVYKFLGPFFYLISFLLTFGCRSRKERLLEIPTVMP